MQHLKDILAKIEAELESVGSATNNTKDHVDSFMTQVLDPIKLQMLAGDLKNSHQTLVQLVSDVRAYVAELEAGAKETTPETPQAPATPAGSTTPAQQDGSGAAGTTTTKPQASGAAAGAKKGDTAPQQ